MLTFEQIQKAYLEDTKKLYLNQKCAVCSNDLVALSLKAEEPTRNEEVRLYAYLYEKYPDYSVGIFSLCPECDLKQSDQWGPSYVLSEQELFTYLLFS